MLRKEALAAAARFLASEAACIAFSAAFLCILGSLPGVGRGRHCGRYSLVGSRRGLAGLASFLAAAVFAVSAVLVAAGFTFLDRNGGRGRFPGLSRLVANDAALGLGRPCPLFVGRQVRI